jgi:predicted nucleotidyltransferase
MTSDLLGGIEVSTLSYEGKNVHARRIADLLRPHADKIFGAYVHGSVATGEEIAYSDFDALVILSESCTPPTKDWLQLQNDLKKCEQAMFDFDPLQHHGWFVLNERDLSNYDETYFPHELFEHSRALLANKGNHITIRHARGGCDMRMPFLSLARNVRASLQSGCATRNMYLLKSVLSGFMLLPSLYVQARTGRGIFKKFSFEAARLDFSDDVWAPMDRVSEVRQQWHYEIGPLRRWLLTSPVRFRRRLARAFAPGVPMTLCKTLSPDLFGAMDWLVLAMERKLAE